MNRPLFVIVVLTVLINQAFSQNFRITPNNNQYYFTDYVIKNDSGSLGKLLLTFNVIKEYRSTLANPRFKWTNGTGLINSKMVMSGVYEIELDIVYKKYTNSQIEVSELNDPKIIDIEIGDLNKHLIKIEYLSDLSQRFIERKISKFYPMEAGYKELIDFVYDYNFILRKYDPYGELIFPEIITDDFSKKINQTVEINWKKIKIKSFYSLCRKLKSVLQNDSAQNVDPLLVDALAGSGSIKLNCYNAYRIDYIISLLQNSLALEAKHSREIDRQILENLNDIKAQNIDSTDRYLVIAHVNRKGFQVNNLSVAYTPGPFQILNYSQRQKEYFRCPTSPTYNIFVRTDYLVWVENKANEKVSPEKILNPHESKFKEIVLPVESSLAIVRLPENFGKGLKFDRWELEKEINNLIIRHKCLFLSNVSIPL